MTAEKRLLGHKHIKDGLTLALCDNARENCAIKPQLFYCFKDQRTVMSYRILIEKIQIMWRANLRACVNLVTLE